MRVLAKLGTSGTEPSRRGVYVGSETAERKAGGALVQDTKLLQTSLNLANLSKTSDEQTTTSV